MTRSPCFAVLACAVFLAACHPAPRTGVPSPERGGISVIPAPVSVTVARDSMLLTDSLAIVVDANSAELTRTAEILAALLRSSTGFLVPVVSTDTLLPTNQRIALRLDPAHVDLGAEGYELTVTHDSARILAATPAGVFHGVQTLRQLLPAAIESHVNFGAQQWIVPAVHVVDSPRFAWRGAMLDVARHFFTPDEVKQYVDILALYKFSVLHLHLADDQGWRIEIRSHPELVGNGAGSEVAGGPGGYYTQEQFSDLVRYAADRYLTIVPEIDMPGHSNAMLLAHPDLSCGRRAPALFTGIEVGFSSLCTDKEGTYALIEDIVREIAALTPGAYFHMGGDEVEELTPEQYSTFVGRVQEIVQRQGKRAVGWEEVRRSSAVDSTTLIQQWRGDTLSLVSGGKLILSPGKRMYIDMKYSASTEVGLRWAGLIQVSTVYDWDPAAYNPGVPETAIAGVEAPLWSETIRNITAAEYLAMPRLPAVAEVGWTPQARRQWDEFRSRLATHASRWNYLGINYHRSTEIPWP